MARVQDWEVNSENKKIPINPTLQRAAGLHVHKEKVADDPCKKRVFTSEIHLSNDKKRPHQHANDPPAISLAIPDKEVKRRTGFPTLGHLLSYIFIATDGDIKLH